MAPAVEAVSFLDCFGWLGAADLDHDGHIGCFFSDTEASIMFSDNFGIVPREACGRGVDELL